MFRAILRFVLVISLLASAADADVIITLEARDANGALLPTQVPAGTRAHVTALLYADGRDNPLPDVRLIQFDFSLTNSGIEVDSFVWLVDRTPYSEEFLWLPLVTIVSSYFSSSPDLLTLTGTTLPVATFGVTINESGVLDVMNANASDTNTGAAVSALFSNREDFAPVHGNIRGGRLAFVVASTGGNSDDTHHFGIPTPPAHGFPGGGLVDETSGLSDAGDGESVMADAKGNSDDAIPDGSPGTEDDGGIDESGQVSATSGAAVGSGTGDSGLIGDSNGEQGNSETSGNPSDTPSSENDTNGGNTDPEATLPRPVRMCGMGILPILFLIVVGLHSMNHQRRRLQ